MSPKLNFSFFSFRKPEKRENVNAYFGEAQKAKCEWKSEREDLFPPKHFTYEMKREKCIRIWLQR